MKKRTISKLLICVILLSLNTNKSFSQEVSEGVASSNRVKQSVSEKETKKTEESAEKTNTEEKNEIPKPEDKIGNEAPVVEKSTTPAPLKAETREATPKYQGKVTFVGQWTDESKKKEDTTKDFKNADEKLGDPATNHGLFRSIAKTFLGWSDKPPVENGKLADGARLFSKEDKISTAFPNGIPADAKLYGVYFSLNEPNTPFPTDKIGMGFSLVGGISKIKINANEVTIDKNEKSEDVLPDTKLKEEKTEGTTRKIIDVYGKKDDKKDINEVVLNSEFKMDDTVAMLVYKNPSVGYVGPVLSNTYKNNEFKTDDGKTGYTYVDLVVNLDNDLTVPDKLYLEFEGYSWRPLYVLGPNKEVLNVFDPKTDNNLGNTKDSFNSLVRNDIPKVTFGVESKNSKDITVRMILRTDNEKISENNITPDVGGTIAEKILQNMKLRSLSKSDLKILLPNKTEEDINKSVLRISDEKAKELAETDGKTTLKITGYVKGNAVANGGNISLFSLKFENAINKVQANTLALGYTTEKYNITYTFISGTEGRDLPTEIIEKQPQDKFGIETGTKESLEKYVDVKVDGGTWKFRNWYLEKEDETEIVGNEVTVENNDLVLVGEWVFVPEAEKYNITYTFVSGTKGKDLPVEVIEKQPQDKFSVENGMKEKLEKYEDIKVEGGTWKFKNWNLEKENETEIVENEVTVEGNDLVLIGEWIFEENKKPEPSKPQPESPKPKPQPQPESPKPEPKLQPGSEPDSKTESKPKLEQNIKKLPKTNLQRATLYTLMTLVGLSGVYISKKKKDDE